MKRPVNSKLMGMIMLSACSMGHAANDYIQGHLGGVSNQINQDVGDVPGNRYNANLYFDYHKELGSSGQSELEKRFSFTAEINDQSLTTYSLPEAYVGGMLTNKDRVRFGRQVLPWSEVDHVWGFGKVNNRINFDFFEPGQEGLIGLLYERKSANGMRYRAFVSGIYVPEMNPPLDIDNKNKTISKKHRWSDSPAPSAELEPGDNVPVAYHVDEPKISEVIYRYSIGANIGYESKHWVWDNFVLRKPENQISAKVSISVPPTAEVVNAFIKPQFYYHDVLGSTVKYRNLGLEMYVSGITVRPNTFPDGDEDATRFTDIKTKKAREDYVGGGISKSNDLYGVGVNYVARLSPFDRNKESLTVDPRWNQAVNVFASRNFGRSFSALGDIKYDTLTTDRLIMFRGIYKVSKDLQMSAGMNLIGSPDDGKSFWSSYTNNDSIYGGLKYVF